MKKRYILVLLAASLLAVQGFGVGPAGALITTYSGNSDSTDPQMPVVFISTPTCTGQGSTLVHYDVVEFADPEPGTHIIDLTVGVEFAGMYLYEGSFDPNDGMQNCVAATNSNPANITYDFLDNTPYYLVVFDDTFAQQGGPWEVTVESPDPPPTTTTTSTTTTSTTVAPTTTVAAPLATVAPAAQARAAVPAFTG